jgi:hypothetical protein
MLKHLRHHSTHEWYRFNLNALGDLIQIIADNINNETDEVNRIIKACINTMHVQSFIERPDDFLLLGFEGEAPALTGLIPADDEPAVPAEPAMEEVKEPEPATAEPAVEEVKEPAPAAEPAPLPKVDDANDLDQAAKARVLNMVVDDLVRKIVAEMKDGEGQSKIVLRRSDVIEACAVACGILKKPKVRAKTWWPVIKSTINSVRESVEVSYK